jgi:serine/threonine protein phosphatase PrpC
MVSDDDIRGIVGANTDIRDACRKLIQRANERGGEDNITAVLIKIEEIEEPKIDPGPADEKRGAGPTDPAPPAAPEKTGT